jgi:hypothetical protein
MAAACAVQLLHHGQILKKGVVSRSTTQSLRRCAEISQLGCLAWQAAFQRPRPIASTISRAIRQDSAAAVPTAPASKKNTPSSPRL